MTGSGVGETDVLAPSEVRLTLVQEWRAHWRIGVAAFLALGFSIGAYSTVASLFVIPLQEAFGWSRGEIALAYNASLISGMCCPFVGRAVDRFGARKIMLFGMIGFAFSYFGMAAMNGSLPLFYALYVLVNVLGLTSSGLTCSRVVSQAFVSSRGFSLAAARSGMALAGAVFPGVLWAVISQFGWRGGYVAQGLMVLVFAWPAVFFWIGRSNGRTAPAPPVNRHVAPRWGTLLRQRKVWLVCLGAACGYAPAMSLMTQLQPLLIGKGLGSGIAAALVGMTGIASFLGAMITGALVDRFWAPGVALMFACGSVAGCLILALTAHPSTELTALAIVLIGLGLGAEIDVVAYIVARYFGVQNFSTLYGVTTFFLSVSGAIGATLLGFAYDRFGNYDLALQVMAGVFLFAGLIYLPMGRYPLQEPTYHD